VRRIVVPVVIAVVVATGAVVVLVRSHGSTAGRQLSSYLRAWSAGDAAGMAKRLDAPPADLAAVANSLVRSRPGSHLTLTPGRVTGSSATYHAHAVLPGFGAFDWDGSLGIVKGRIHWSEADLYPGLTGDQHLVFQRVWAQRAPILAADGTPLVGEQPAVVIGLEPDHITDLAQVQGTLSAVLGVSPAAVQHALAAPGVKPSFFVPIVTLATAAYTPLRPQLAPVPGIVFRRTQARIAASPAPILGTVGEITAQRLAQLGAPYQVGDQVGLSGLEAAYENRLAGRPSGEVDIVSGATAVRTVKQYPGTQPQPVQTTLDLRTQQAAEAALAAVTGPAALVAVDAATGGVRAVVSTPLSQPFDRALEGAYPPGSTFKVVTTAALLAAGRTSSTPSSCPPRLTVDGRVFGNFEGEAPGSIPLSQAFAISCNTAFIGLAQQLPGGALAAAARQFGFGQPSLGAGGGYPTPADGAEAAASAVGQGRVTASPLQMAMVAATVDAGQWHPPQLVLQPAATTNPAAVAPLDAGLAGTLRDLMRQVVVSGTGTAAAVPGQVVFGKTGTAEFGNTTPPATHAWFIGFRDGLAFAVLVEGGGVGGRVAAPLAAKFLATAP